MSTQNEQDPQNVDDQNEQSPPNSNVAIPIPRDDAPPPKTNRRILPIAYTLPISSSSPVRVISSLDALNSPRTLESQRLAQSNPDIADQPRRIDYPAPGEHNKPSQFYQPVISGKWWSVTSEQWAQLDSVKRRSTSMVGRIMETTFGERLDDDKRCDSCKKRGFECWIFTPEGQSVIANPGVRCARCRASKITGGCSLTKKSASTQWAEATVASVTPSPNQQKPSTKIETPSANEFHEPPTLNQQPQPHPEDCAECRAFLESGSEFIPTDEQMEAWNKEYFALE